MSKLRESLASGKFTFTGEIGPPKGINIEPVFQMVCRDRNRLALQSDLLSAAVFGIENVLALTGDHIVMGDHQDAKGVYDLDSVGLLRAMSKLEEGTDMGVDMKGNPNTLDGAPTFFKGCCVTPCAPTPDAQAIKLERKVEAGAQFAVTQPVYDEASAQVLREATRHAGIPIIMGILPLRTPRHAEFLHQRVAGIAVPQAVRERMERASDPVAEGAANAREMLRVAREGFRGACLMPPFGHYEVVGDVLGDGGGREFGDS